MLLKKIARKLGFLQEEKPVSEEFVDKTPEEVFNRIFKNNYWASSESVSGPGSSLSQTSILIQSLKSLIKEKNINTMLDLPCGDFNWMKYVVSDDLYYIGGDIVEETVEGNNEKYYKPNCKFMKLNLMEDDLPPCELLLVRDCLVHFSFADQQKAFSNIKRSKCTYLLTTTFTNYKSNVDIVTGDWRPINLSIAPFNWPSPLLYINENCTELDGIYKDKSLGLWRIEDL